MVASQPALTPAAVDVKTNVKHPVAEVDVNEGGKFAPV